MYIIVNKKSQKSYIYKYAVDVIRRIMCNKKTITNNKHLYVYLYDVFKRQNALHLKIIDVFNL